MAVSDSLKQTPLFDLHLELNARMVPFAGYSMPVQYEGVIMEHLHTRESAGLFDVSHMGQVLIQGENAALALEQLLPVDLVNQPVSSQLYTQLLNPAGGIIDDLMITRWGEDKYFAVLNAACKDKDLRWMTANLEGLTIEILSDRALVALQGPGAVDIVEKLLPDAGSLTFMHGCHTSFGDTSVFIARSGYTGEDGFEISVPGDKASSLCREILTFPEVKAVGLGARDTLRLEAGLCLYGHDLDETTTPVAAALAWSISKARRSGGERAGGFPGDNVILEELESGTVRKRVGLRVEGKAPVREGAELVNDNTAIGNVTSGSFAPSMDAPIAMGYVDSAFTVQGTELSAMVRGKALPVTVVPMPFVPHRYVR